MGTNYTEAIELKALYEIALLIGSAHDLATTLTSILKVMHDILQMERATLFLLDESGRFLSIKASYGLSHDERKRGVYRLDEGITGKIFASRTPFVVPDIHSEPLFLNKTRSREVNKETLSFLGVPVLVAGEPAGVLTADRLFGLDIPFAEDIRFLTVVATLIAQFLVLSREIRKNEAHLREENRSLRARLTPVFSRHDILGQSKVMQEVFVAISKVAPSSATVLLLGESGTGKELVARAVHQASRRHSRPFLTVNCAALPENLLESELIGHEKGAFTNALALKKGRFELADSGTLFLDEIGEMPLELQAKLLRVLQEQRFERLGGTATISVDVRIIAATNRSLAEAVARGSFRADLYYRLNVVPIVLPPLRDRAEDIPLLIDHFLALSNRQNRKSVRLSREVMDFLVRYPWPGNVREMQNLMERLVIMADRSQVQLTDLPPFVVAEPEEAGPRHTLPGLPVSGGSKRPSLEAMERGEIEAALKRHGWVQARAARELGLTARQMGYKIRKYGLSRPEFA
ncbi:MAG TPA: sigma-54-dependent Fis family transcriptional regulator [Desulfobulbaceae bacterium]|nr:sigma-54-dependent Fis family transcriptional regulator [Desulfobulbaceae bacterium]